MPPYELALDETPELTVDDVINRYISLPKDWLKDLGHLAPRTMAMLALALCRIDDPTSNYNERKSKMTYATIRDALHLGASYKGSNMRRWVEAELEKLHELKIDGKRIFTGLANSEGMVYFAISEQALPYFQGFSKGSGKEYKKAWAEDLYGLKNCYAFDYYRLLLLHCWKEEPYKQYSFSVGILKEELGLAPNAYEGANGEFDRDSFCKTCINNPLADVAKGRMFRIYQHGKCGKYYHKNKPGKRNGDKVLGYYITWLADFDIKKSDNKKGVK